MRDLYNHTSESYSRTWTEWDDGRVPRPTFPSPTIVSVGSRARGDLRYSNHRIATIYGGYRAEHILHPCISYTGWNSNYTVVDGKPHWGKTRGVYENRIFSSASLRETGYAGNPDILDSLDLKSSNKVLSSMSSADVDIGTFLGELPQSVSMIAKAAITVLQGYRAARRGDFKSLRRILGVGTSRDRFKSPANAWFAYKFGWLPLVTDVYNMHDAVQKQLQHPKLRKWSRDEESSEPIEYSQQGYYSLMTRTGSERSSSRTSVTATVEKAWMHNLNALGLLNPVAVAWELVPLSFVVDWFLPIGSFLQNSMATAGLEFRHGYVTRFARKNYVASDTFTRVPYHGVRTSSTFTGSSFQRAVLGGFPDPGLAMTLKLNRNQVLTAIGLISQRV